jgi:hypothetical protein
VIGHQYRFVADDGMSLRIELKIDCGFPLLEKI